MDRKVLEKITGIYIGLTLLTILLGLLFLSLIFDNGYQLYFAFLLIPAMTLLQLYKIFFLYKSNLPTHMFTTAVIMVFVIYTPLLDAWIHSTKITYPLSVITYFGMAIFYIIETRNVTGKKDNIDD